MPELCLLPPQGGFLHSDESWRWVPGFQGLYCVSDFGRIYSSYRKGKLLRQQVDRHGYCCVTLYEKRVSYWRLVHTMVLEAFVGPKPEGMECCHGPLGRKDNTLSNLSWGLPSKNQNEDKLRDGTHNRGIRHYLAKLNEKQALAIFSDPRRYDEIAGDYNVTPQNVYAIKSGKSWSWLTNA